MYLALYRKYRSSNFDEVISQEHITTTLKNQIKSGKLAHAYLFTGSRGTGKTSCAKLLAKAVNCLSNEDGNPCGECEICKAIAAGCSDVVEMDAASNNSVDDVRALRDEVMYSPVLCKYRVYIIDEVHMLSTSAFNALLKTVEEPPPHVIFILATTEVHKVPATILSRCQQFSFRRIDARDSTKRLCEIAAKENAEIDVSAAELISRLSDGGMRDAVSLLDQCLSVTRHVTEQTVRDTAGVAGTQHLFALADCIAAKNGAAALKILDELHAASKDLVLLLEEMTGHMRNLMMLSAMNMDFSLIPAGSGDKNALAAQTQKFTTGEIIRCIEILQEFSAKAGKATRRKTLAEMCFIKLCNPRLDSETTALSLRLEKLEQRVDGLKNEPSVQPRTAPMVRQITAQPPALSENEPNNNDKDTAVIRQQERNAPVAEAAPSATKKELTEKTEPASSAPTAPENEEENEAPPAWLFEGDEPSAPSVTPTEYDDYPPFAIDVQATDEPQSEIEPQTAVTVQTEQPSDSEEPPFDSDEAPFDMEEAPFDTEEPPFDIGQQTAVAEEQSQRSEDIQGYGLPPEPALDYGAPLAKEAAVSASFADNGEWREIISELPDFLAALLKDVKARITDTNIVLSGYSQFLRDFLKKGDSVMRIEAAAKNVVGRNLRLTYDESQSEAIQDKSDRADDFIKRAAGAGVKIKTKSRK